MGAKFSQILSDYSQFHQNEKNSKTGHTGHILLLNMNLLFCAAFLCRRPQINVSLLLFTGDLTL